jgi:hypothetical protein
MMVKARLSDPFVEIAVFWRQDSDHRMLASYCKFS